VNIPLFRTDCGPDELRRVGEVLASGWLTTGEVAREFEERFAEAVGARHAVSVDSGTAALMLAAEAAEIRPGVVALVPTFTFTATAEVVHRLGGTVVLADCDPDSGLLTPEILEETLNRHPEVRVAFVVHLGGLAADLEAMLAICERRGVLLIEDAAHAFPSRYPSHRRMVGAGGSLAACFSFYANKTITCGEGGMLVTDDAMVAERARRLRLHGMVRESDQVPIRYDVPVAGFKCNLSDIHAAVGLAQLERSDHLHAQRIRVARRYLDGLASQRGIAVPVAGPRLEDHAWHLFSVLVDESGPIDRDRLARDLATHGIGTSIHYRPLHRLSHWREACRAGADERLFPGAERRWRGTLSLPIFPSMTDDEVDRVGGVIAKAFVATDSHSPDARSPSDPMIIGSTGSS
jgi:dTDP-4-amino-4,6-dideoxygalactose transaminase